MMLRDWNPSIKGLAIIVAVILLSLTFDPVTPLFALAYTILFTFGLGRVPWRRWLLGFVPFFIMGFGYVWTALLFPRSAATEASAALWQWGSFIVTEATLHQALSLGLRVLIFSALSLIFILTTDPVRFMLSLMQQCKLSPKWAYGILAGYRFLPFFKEELRILQHAHRMRGVERERGWKNKLRAWKRYAIPLLASAIRKSERVAAAMFSKGFTGRRGRIYYTELRVTWKDWLLFALLHGGIALCYFLSWKLGYVQWYRGQL
ncbi:energy-coupling factor transporter transmembrane component T family protein [Paenibacillus apiarius]|uniref:Energy-coupling factor transporter transmembrane protein EcfT n=1 Tax=Paenibacillus apiarius TaxID=46240 RepID=A0ABT4DS56_9BACL|nr:energy-coupling factor transporter transmembrane component T [Paenibacillus apiarius]MCY9515529.1 energy-coupling factor transporter transmembrane protein EcfT [Paenibacillus apiarius]MCY9518938.1 energy-coupling factor transporter transmembrane protein EcfT [Paenibacillus apiarius]MCY9552016.1 energy-coupling factor transporter transmembrane protein EcfT [Paenibacillus apiarius]MCY9557308.1 energy-coupling factor transporter transmembrane protein EcfT [Paenibacillus apiarius]MCY9682513.1 e